MPTEDNDDLDVLLDDDLFDELPFSDEVSEDEWEEFYQSGIVWENL